MKKIVYNNYGSVDPVIITVIVFCIAAIVILLLGEIIPFFMQLMDSSDDSIDVSISTPRSYMLLFIGFIWPKGILIFVFVVVLAGMLMEYNKAKYKEG